MAAQDVADAVENLHLDNATGEMVSKTELKKRVKAREREARRQERQQTSNAADAPANAASAEASE